jgi:erythromycin esterase
VGIDFQEPVKTFSFVEAYAKRYLRALMPDIDLWHGCLSNYGPARCDAALTSIRAGVAQSRPASQGQLQAQRLASHALEILERGRTLLDHRSFAQRDRTMAANVQWIAQTLYPNARIIVSAHDDHVCTYDPHWPATMGTELRKLYGNAYYALGMTFGSGTVRAHRIAGGPFVPVRVDGDTGNTTAALFNSIDRPFFLNIDAVTPGSALAEWLNARQTMWMPGGVIFPENVRAYALGNLTLSRAFDSLIFVPASHATTLL